MSMSGVMLRAPPPSLCRTLRRIGATPASGFRPSLGGLEFGQRPFRVLPQAEPAVEVDREDPGCCIFRAPPHLVDGALEQAVAGGRRNGDDEPDDGGEQRLPDAAREDGGVDAVAGPGQLLERTDEPGDSAKQPEERADGRDQAELRQPPLERVELRLGDPFHFLAHRRIGRTRCAAGSSGLHDGRDRARLPGERRIRPGKVAAVHHPRDRVDEAVRPRPGPHELDELRHDDGERDDREGQLHGHHRAAELDEAGNAAERARSAILCRRGSRCPASNKRCPGQLFHATPPTVHAVRLGNSYGKAM